MLLAGLLAAMAERLGADPDDAADTGYVWGTEAGRRTRSAQLRARPGRRAGAARLRARGRRRADGTAEGAARIEFLHCPFRELAEAYPELVCNLHRGLCEGVVDQVGGGSVEEFSTLYDPEPCHVTVSVGYPDRQDLTLSEALDEHVQRHRCEPMFLSPTRPRPR